MITRRFGSILISLALLLITLVLLWQGQRYMMQTDYNEFLLSLGAMALCLVLLIWYTGAEEIEDRQDEK